MPARSTASISMNAHLLLNPPGMEPQGLGNRSVVPYYSPVSGQSHIDDHGVYPLATTSAVSPSESAFIEKTVIILVAVSASPVLHLPLSSFTYSRLTRPCPAAIHSNYPFHTPGGADSRWSNYAEIGEGSRWVGGLLCVDSRSRASFCSSGTSRITAQILGPSDGRQYASFNWSDLWTIAPWLEEIITKRIDGQGLGH